MLAHRLIGLARGAASGDPYWSNVSSLLHMDGADGSTTFTDEKGVSWTAQGSARIETDFYKFGGSAGWFQQVASNPGSRITTPDSAAFRFGTGDWTVEGWFRVSAPTIGLGGFFVKGENTSGGMILALTPTLATFRANGTTDSTFSLSLSSTTWYHIAFVRNGGTIEVFVDGVSAGTASRSFDHTDTSALIVGSATSDLRFAYNGMIDEMRITKGVARYTANFTSPTAPFPNG